MLTSRIMSLRGVQRRSNPQHSGGDCFATLAMTWRKRGGSRVRPSQDFSEAGCALAAALRVGVRRFLGPKRGATGTFIGQKL